MIDIATTPPQVDSRHSALIILDMISAWRFPDADKVLPAAVAIAPVVAALKARCKAAGIPVLYANDNHGQWRSDWRHLMDSALGSGGDGARVAEALAPDDDDYFVLKPMHSGFFATPLQLLLQHLGATRLLLAGVTSDQCVLATAASARMHQYEVVVPCDAVGTQTVERARAAVTHFTDVMKLDTTASTQLALT